MRNKDDVGRMTQVDEETVCMVMTCKEVWKTGHRSMLMVDEKVWSVSLSVSDGQNQIMVWFKSWFNHVV